LGPTTFHIPVTLRVPNCHTQVWNRYALLGTIDAVKSSALEEAPMHPAPEVHAHLRAVAAALARATRRAQTAIRHGASQIGQGTVEYVALILLVALVMAGVVAAMKGYKTDGGKDLGDAIVGKIKDAVGKVEF
jgi:hypothetical protein